MFFLIEIVLTVPRIPINIINKTFFIFSRWRKNVCFYYGCLRQMLLLDITRPLFILGLHLAVSSSMAKLECSKIFIVEDDKNIREMFEHVLKDEGFGVESFADGQKAINRLRSAPEPCLVLLDMLMPVMNGEEFMNHFHDLPATILSIPVFLVSATSNAGNAKRIGCKGFVKKPVDIDALLVIVKQYCEISKHAA